MNLVQLAGRHCRLTEELVNANAEVPRNAGRIDRLTHELAATARELSAVRAKRAVVSSTPNPMTSRQDNRHDTHAWLGSFAGRLLQLRPAMSVGAAVRYAVMSIHHAAALEPRRAAELLLMNDPTPAPVVRPSMAARRPVRVNGLSSLFDPRRSKPSSSGQPIGT
jgi:hypothetical protein